MCFKKVCILVVMVADGHPGGSDPRGQSGRIWPVLRPHMDSRTSLPPRCLVRCSSGCELLVLMFVRGCQGAQGLGEGSGAGVLG